MYIAAIDSIVAAVSPPTLPMTLKQSSARLPAVTLIAVSTFAIAGLLVPAGIVAAHALTDPRLLETMAARPLTNALLAAGLGLAMGLFAIPFGSGMRKLRQRCAVQLTRDGAKVEDRGLFGVRRWEAPISQFRGVTHHIRATLSGGRHEIILVHPEPGKDILLGLSTRAPDLGAEHYARLLGLDVLPAGVLYGGRQARAASVATVRGPVALRQAA